MGGSASNGHLVIESMEGTERVTVVNPGSLVKLLNQLQSALFAI